MTGHAERFFEVTQAQRRFSDEEPFEPVHVSVFEAVVRSEVPGEAVVEAPQEHTADPQPRPTKVESVVERSEILLEQVARLRDRGIDLKPEAHGHREHPLANVVGGEIARGLPEALPFDLDAVGLRRLGGFLDRGLRWGRLLRRRFLRSCGIGGDSRERTVRGNGRRQERASEIRARRARHIDFAFPSVRF